MSPSQRGAKTCTDARAGCSTFPSYTILYTSRDLWSLAALGSAIEAVAHHRTALGEAQKKNFKIIDFSLAQARSRRPFDRIETPAIHAAPRPPTRFSSAHMTRAGVKRRVRTDDLTPPKRSKMCIARRGIPAPRDACCTGKISLYPERVSCTKQTRAHRVESGLAHRVVGRYFSFLRNRPRLVVN